MSDSPSTNHSRPDEEEPAPPPAAANPGDDRRLLGDARIIELLREMPHDDPRWPSVRTDLREALLGALIRLHESGGFRQGQLDRKDLDTVAVLAVDQFIEHAVLGGQWRSERGITVKDALVARGEEVLEELRRGRGVDRTPYATLGRLVADLPAEGLVSTVAALVRDTGSVPLAAVLLLERGVPTATVAASLGVDEELVRVAMARFWSRIDRTLGQQSTGRTPNE